MDRPSHTFNSNTDEPFKEYFQLFARISKQIHSNTGTKDILSCIVENITDILLARESPKARYVRTKVGRRWIQVVLR